jgi:hypothetical protein
VNDEKGSRRQKEEKSDFERKFHDRGCCAGAGRDVKPDASGD